MLNNKHICYSTAIAFNILHRILYTHINKGMKLCNRTHENGQNLIYTEEKELI